MLHLGNYQRQRDERIHRFLSGFTILGTAMILVVCMGRHIINDVVSVSRRRLPDLIKAGWKCPHCNDSRGRFYKEGGFTMRECRESHSRPWPFVCWFRPTYEVKFNDLYTGTRDELHGDPKFLTKLNIVRDGFTQVDDQPGHNGPPITNKKGKKRKGRAKGKTRLTPKPSTVRSRSSTRIESPNVYNPDCRPPKPKRNLQQRNSRSTSPKEEDSFDKRIDALSEYSPKKVSTCTKAQRSGDCECSECMDF